MMLSKFVTKNLLVGLFVFLVFTRLHLNLTIIAKMFPIFYTINSIDYTVQSEREEREIGARRAT